MVHPVVNSADLTKALTILSRKRRYSREPHSFLAEQRVQSGPQRSRSRETREQSEP